MPKKVDPEVAMMVKQSRRMLLRAIDLERDNHLHEGFDAAHDATLLAGQWVGILCRHAGMALDDGGGTDVPRFKRQLIRVGSVSLAALEAFGGLTEEEIQTYVGTAAGPTSEHRGKGY